MLRYKKKVDFEAVHAETVRACQTWRELHEKVPEEIRQEFHSKLVISIIYHDAALEGAVLTHSEIKASIDKSIISDTSLIPSYETINNFNNALLCGFEIASQKRKAISLESIKQIQKQLRPEVDAAYRKENPLHRLYYHEIAPPEKINAQMRKLADWLEDGDAKLLRPIERASLLHWKLMAAFPWGESTGRTARIVANALLEHEGFPLAVLHSIDRQRYYESLRSSDHRQLFLMYLEAVETTAVAAVRVYEEAWQKRGRRKRAS